MLFQVEDMSAKIIPFALEAKLFLGSIPEDRLTAFTTNTAYGGVYTLALSANELQKYKQYDATIRFFVSVQCVGYSVKFSALLNMVKVGLKLAEVSYGETCPSRWVYHDITLDEDLYADLNELNGDGSSISTGEQLHLQLTLKKTVGALYFTSKLEKMPLRIMPPYTEMPEGQTSLVHQLCDVQHFINMRAGQGEYLKNFFGIVGTGETCTHYELMMVAYQGNCGDGPAGAGASAGADASAGGDASAGSTPGRRLTPATALAPLACQRGMTTCQIEEGRFMHGSCEAMERSAPFIFDVPFTPGMKWNNLVIEIEDIMVEDNPYSLQVAVYVETSRFRPLASHPQTFLANQEAYATSTVSKRKIYAVGIDNVKLEALMCGVNCQRTGLAKIAVLVRCNSKPVRFKVLTAYTQVELIPFFPTVGEVCPGSWIYHTYAVNTTNTATLIRFQITVNKGHIYYAMTRWERPPNFASCNANEKHVGISSRSVEICTERSSVVQTAYLGIRGGRSCSNYEVTVQEIALNESICDTTVTGICSSGLTTS